MGVPYKYTYMGRPIRVWANIRIYGTHTCMGVPYEYTYVGRPIGAYGPTYAYGAEQLYSYVWTIRILVGS